MVLNLDKLKKLGVEVITFGLKCNTCGKVWGLNIQSIENFEDIPANRFVCEHCHSTKVDLTL